MVNFKVSAQKNLIIRLSLSFIYPNSLKYAFKFNTKDKR